MRGFADIMIGSFPAGVRPPGAFVEFFDWLEANAPIKHWHGNERPCAVLNPNDANMSILVEPVDRALVDAYAQGNLEARDRLAPFVRTGGDGSYAGLWIDDEGAIHTVHMGSGSGSVMLCTLASNPVDFLRLLAIGYDALCWPEDFDLTPAEVRRENGENAPDGGGPSPFAEWVATTFRVEIPRTASEIVSDLVEMDAEDSDDPFWLWMRSLEMPHERFKSAQYGQAAGPQ